MGRKQQAAVAINKKKALKASKSSAGKYKIGTMFHKKQMDINKDGKIDRKDFQLMRKNKKK